MRKKVRDCICALHPLSAEVLLQGTRISFLLLVVAVFFGQLQTHSMNTVLVSCAKIYPLLALMVLAITITGALLIDIYDKVHKKER